MKNLIVTLLAAVAAFFVLMFGAIAAQRDTNSTTTATAYTPRQPGDILIGNSAGAKAAWIAGGSTTNDWIKLNSQGISSNFTIGTTTVYVADGVVTNKS